MASLRRIQLVRTPQQVQNPYVSLAFRFTVLAQNGYLIPNQIFVVINRPIDPANPSVTGTKFLGVATPGQLSSLVANTPVSFTDHYRVSLIDVTYRSENEANEAWNKIQCGATELVNALNAIDTLSNPTTIWIGTPP